MVTCPQSFRTVCSVTALAALMWSCGPVQATEQVDVELVLAVDVSLSMSPDELEIQRNGYAAALRDKTVIDAIRNGAHGRVAIAYFEWAGTSMRHTIVPWTVISSAGDAERVAAQLSIAPPNSARRTSISGALEYADGLFAQSPYRGAKRVVDVSGDGANNQGAPVAVMRDALVAKGISINGLPLMTNGGYVTDFDIKNLDAYYKDCVIGGPGAFVIPVNDWKQFPEAIRRKLVLEIAGAPEPAPLFVPAQYSPEAQSQPQTRDAPMDCEVGEKAWRNRQMLWEAQ